MEAALLQTYCVRPKTEVRWVVETNGILLLGRNAAHKFLGYPEASVWDCISRSYKPEKIVELLCAIAQVERETAVELYIECVNELVKSEYLERPVDE